MNPTQKLISDRIMNKTVEEVSRLFFPKYWDSKEAEEAAKDALLADALTIHDQPCMSYFRE